MIKVGVVGGTGRLGVELLRLLVMHPNVRIQVVTSRKHCGERVHDRFPFFRHHFEAEYVLPTPENLARCDVVFLAAPEGVALELAPQLLTSKTKIIDLSADFRFQNVETWETQHGQAHPCPALLNEAVYGLPEINRTQIRRARLVANPGSYATAILIGVLPLLEKKLIDNTRLIADVKSSATADSDAQDNIRVLDIGPNVVQREIAAALHHVTSQNIDFVFVPHQIPVVRGMHATLYVDLHSDAEIQPPIAEDLQALYHARFESEPFVDMQSANHFPETRSVRGSNMCRVALHRPRDSNTVVILSVIDNLVKGAAGQAIQNMNLLFGIPEAIGLKHLALMP